ncbi:hypothetical protein ABGV36_20970 [Escherichia coli]
MFQKRKKYVIYELKEFAQEQEQKLISALADTREHPLPDGETRSRDNYQRDYARILYSSSFRRLQEKITQLFEIDPEKFNRNRLTQQLEVAQIARSIASDIKLVNPVVVELQLWRMTSEILLSVIPVKNCLMNCLKKSAAMKVMHRRYVS